MNDSEDEKSTMKTKQSILVKSNSSDKINKKNKRTFIKRISDKENQGNQEVLKSSMRKFDCDKKIVASPQILNK